MLSLPRIAAAATLVTVAAASPASAAWTPPTTLSTGDEANPVAQGAFGGSVVTGWLEPTAALSKRLGPLSPLTAPDPFEETWAAGLDADGDAIVLTLRRHKPLQRVRAIIGGVRRTISDNTHTADTPVLSVAPDGTAVAGWAWHDPAGWRAQVAVRRPGQPRFEAPQTVSPPAPARVRPIVQVAAGEGGRGVVVWQVQGGPAHVTTAGPDSVFGNDQELPKSAPYADVSAAVGADGAVQLAYLGGRSLRVTHGTAGAPLPAPSVLATGGKGTSSGTQVATAFSGDGTATVAWAKPGPSYEEGGTLEVYTRTPGAAFGPPQTLAEGALGVVLAGGPGNAAALAWMIDRPRHSVHAAIRTAGRFGPDTTISTPDRHALWPSIAMTPAGEAIAAWVTNTTGGGSGNPAAALWSP